MYILAVMAKVFAVTSAIICAGFIAPVVMMSGLFVAIFLFLWVESCFNSRNQKK